MKDGQVTTAVPKRTATVNPSLSRRIVIGLAAGIAIGLFVGDRASVFRPLADGYVKLLQMTVLPYVTVSIIAGLGALSTVQARMLGTRMLAVLLLLWILAIAAVLLFPLMFPPYETASFFSTALLEEREPFNFVDLYIPTNPFNSLANNVVPAVVLFSILVGVAVISVPEKTHLLSVLSVVGSAVSKATEFVIALTPYGMCAIAAVVAGTLSVEELERLQVYLFTYTAVALLVSLWVLPGLVAALTPVPYRALITQSRDVLLMAFMTTSLFAVLPLLTERARSLVREHAGLDEPAASATDVIVPVSFNFPHTGKILTLSFVLFAAWYMDGHLTWSDYPRFASTGLLAMFGSANAAIPFLLDLLRLPADAFQLFLASGAVNARTGSLVASVHTLAMAVLGTCAVAGVMTFDARKILRYVMVTIVLTAIIVGGTRGLLLASLSRDYAKDAVLTGMRLRHGEAGATVIKHGTPEPSFRPIEGSLLDRVRERGVLRVGYFDDSLPYAFFNRYHELVGFDIDMALALGRDLALAVELVPVNRGIFQHGLDASICDVVMSGVAITVDRAPPRFQTGRPFVPWGRYGSVRLPHRTMFEGFTTN
jgi:Na+/H+-dicarboxylate symporter